MEPPWRVEESPGREVERVSAGTQPWGGSGWSWGRGTWEAGENTVGAEASGWPAPQPSPLDPTGGHHPALLFTVYTPLDGREGPRPPQGAHLEGAPSTRRGRCPACPPTHAAVGTSICQLCGREGHLGWGKDIKGCSPRVDAGWVQGPGRSHSQDTRGGQARAHRGHHSVRLLLGAGGHPDL